MVSSKGNKRDFELSSERQSFPVRVLGWAWWLESVLKKLETGHPVILFDCSTWNLKTLTH